MFHAPLALGRFQNHDEQITVGFGHNDLPQLSHRRDLSMEDLAVLWCVQACLCGWVVSLGSQSLERGEVEAYNGLASPCVARLTHKRGGWIAVDARNSRILVEMSIYGSQVRSSLKAFQIVKLTSNEVTSRLDLNKFTWCRSLLRWVLYPTGQHGLSK